MMPRMLATATRPVVVRTKTPLTNVTATTAMTVATLNRPMYGTKKIVLVTVTVIVTVIVMICPRHGWLAPAVTTEVAVRVVSHLPWAKVASHLPRAKVASHLPRATTAGAVRVASQSHHPRATIAVAVRVASQSHLPRATIAVAGRVASQNHRPKDTVGAEARAERDASNHFPRAPLYVKLSLKCAMDSM